MNIKVSKIAKAAWKTFGKKGVGYAATLSANKIISQLSKKYSVKESYAEDLKKEVKVLIDYMSANQGEIEKEKIFKELEGPVATKLLTAAQSSNDGQNFLADIISKLDDSKINDVERFMWAVGKESGADYIDRFRKVVLSVQEQETGTIDSHKSEETNKFEYTDNAKLVPSENGNAISQELTVQEVHDQPATLSQTEQSPAPVVHDNMSDEEDEEFVNNIANDINGALSEVKAKGISVGPADIVGMTKLFIEKSAEVAKFCEEQKTKRTQIRAEAEVAIHQIDALRDFLKDYMERTFDERRTIFDKEFAVVDRCLESGDTQALAISLGAITDLAKSSPFKALSDMNSVRKTLENKGTFDI